MHKDFLSFFSEEGLKAQLGRKADIKMIADIAALKANRDDVEETKGLIEKLNERVKHLAVL